MHKQKKNMDGPTHRDKQRQGKREEDGNLISFFNNSGTDLTTTATWQENNTIQTHGQTTGAFFGKERRRRDEEAEKTRERTMRPRVRGKNSEIDEGGGGDRGECGEGQSLKPAVCVIS